MSQLGVTERGQPTADPIQSQYNKRQPPLEQLIELLRSALPQLAERYGVKSLGVFGSYVRGDQHPGSDLDVLVEFDRTPTLFQLVHLSDELSERLGVKVDLVPKGGLRPAIAQRVLAEVIPV